jgi:hypothetical protein
VSQVSAGNALETDLVRYHQSLADWLVVKQNPPFRQVRNKRNELVWQPVKGGPPDFLATSATRSVLFDAKSIAKPKWQVSLLDAHQFAMLQRMDAIGGTTGIYLRTSEGDAWIPFATVAPLWREWWANCTTGYLTRSDGVAVVGMDWVTAIGGCK